MALRFIRDGMEFWISFESWSTMSVLSRSLEGKFDILLCSCLTFTSFESWEKVEWLSLVRTKPQLTATKLLSSCVPNLSKTEIWEVGWPMRSKTDGFLNSLEDFSSSSTFTVITKTLVFWIGLWTWVGGVCPIPTLEPYPLAFNIFWVLVKPCSSFLGASGWACLNHSAFHSYSHL